MTTDPYIVKLESVSRHFGNFQTLRNLSLVRNGEKVGIAQAVLQQSGDHLPVNT